MESVQVVCQLPKETKVVCDALVKLVGEAKKATADGFQPGSDVPKIVSACMMDLLAAISSVGKIGAEHDAAPKESEQAFALAAVEIKAVLFPKATAPQA